MNRLSLALVVLLSAAGCSTYAANRYAVSVENVSTLRALGRPQINVGPFTATQPGQREINCRAVGPIKTPDGDTFENYIRKAFIDDLRLAESFSSTAAITLTANLDRIDFTSTSGHWSLALTVKSSNGQSLTVSEDYDYKSSWYGETACNQTAQALMPAVQDLLKKLVTSPHFSELVKAS